MAREYFGSIDGMPLSKQVYIMVMYHVDNFVLPSCVVSLCLPPDMCAVHARTTLRRKAGGSKPGGCNILTYRR